MIGFFSMQNDGVFLFRKNKKRANNFDTLNYIFMRDVLEFKLASLLSIFTKEL